MFDKDTARFKVQTLEKQYETVYNTDKAGVNNGWSDGNCTEMNGE